MSNLLSSLIAKTTETAVVLQPRPHALFETAGPAAMPSVPGESPETAESPPQPIQPPAPVEPRHPVPEIKPATVQPQFKPIKQKQAAAESTPASHPSAPPPLTAGKSSPDLSAVAAPEPTPTGDRLPRPQPIVVETHLVREQPVLRPQIRQIVAQETAVPTIKTKQEHAEIGPKDPPNPPARLDSPPVPPFPKMETPKTKHMTETIQTTVITALAGPNAAPRQPEAIVPMQAIPHMPPEQKRPVTDATPPEPVIQVHIGRIEVRATQPETAPPKKQRPLPVMDLDDYLRQRSGQGGKP